MLTRTFLY